MTLESVSFTYTEHHESGAGYIMDGHEHNERYLSCTAARTAAHDILEHLNGHSLIGEPLDELEAFGAVIFMRNYYGDITQQGMVYDVLSVLEHLLADDYHLQRIDPYPAIPDMDDRHLIDMSVSKAFDLLIEQTSRKEVMETFPKHSEARVRRYMKRGWFRACRVYREKSAAASWFNQMADAIEPAMREQYEGHSFVVDYDFDQQRINVRSADELFD